MLDAYVLLTPLALLPVFLLFAFVGCQQILGIDEGIPAPPAPPAEVEFGYSDLPADVEGVVWEFVTSTLVYPAGEEVPPDFDPGPHVRGQPGEPPLLASEEIAHGTLGEPSGGTVSCRAAVVRANSTQPEPVQPVGKSPGDPDFPRFHLTGDPDLELS